MLLRFSRLQTAVHAGSQTCSTSIYLLHDDLDVPENLLVFAHSIKVVIDLLDLLGLLNDETFLLENILTQTHSGLNLIKLAFFVTARIKISWSVCPGKPL